MTGQADLQALLEPTVRGLGYELWGLEFLRQGRRSVLRVFIDSPSGITVEDCATASRQISALLDVEDPIAGEYTLEVSSPGMDRPLFTLEQFRRFTGEEVAVRLRVPQGGRRKFRGLLQAVTADGLVLLQDGAEVALALSAVDKAQLIPRFDDEAAGDGPEPDAG